MSRYNKKRLLLLEFFLDTPHQNEKSLFFPFMKGIAKKNGVNVLWLCFSVQFKLFSEDSSKLTGRRFYVDLSDCDLRTLKMHVENFQPTHVITTEILSEHTREYIFSSKSISKYLVMPYVWDFIYAEEDCRTENYSFYLKIASLYPDNRYYYRKTDWFLRWLGIRVPQECGKFLVEACLPDYAAIMANEDAWKNVSPITILSGYRCSGRSHVTGNRIFQDIDLSACRNIVGCSFCGSDQSPVDSGEIAPVSLAEIQFREILNTAGTCGRNKNCYDIYDIRVFRSFDRFFEMILRLDIPGATFYFSPRIDDILKTQNQIEKTLPALSKAGHEIRVLSMGIENFSEEENTRFNKDITLSQVDGLLEITKKWDSEYPDVFKTFKGGFDKAEWGFILFTPWTTPEDLRINLKHALNRGFSDNGFWLYSTLMIKKGVPIAFLAEKEKGILQENYSDTGILYSWSKLPEDLHMALPWHFRDSRVADYFHILVRICAAERDGEHCQFFADDQDFNIFKKIYFRLPSTFKINLNLSLRSPLNVAWKLLEVITEAQKPYSCEMLLSITVDQLLKQMPDMNAGQNETAIAPDKKPAEGFPKFLSPEADAIHGILQTLPESRVPGLEDIKIKFFNEVADANKTIISIAAVIDGRELFINLLDLESLDPFLFKSRYFKVTLSKDTPVKSSNEKEKLIMLLNLIDKSVEKVRCR